MLSAAQVRERALALKHADPETILLWAVDAFPGKTALTVSFGGGGVVLAHLLSRIDRTVPVLFLDTGFHFAETYAFKERFAKRYGLNLVELKPLTDPGPLYKTDPDRCCYIRENGVPYHPLLDQGYSSIGCWPCTRPTAPGEAERARRWSGSGKTECGLHTFTIKQEV